MFKTVQLSAAGRLALALAAGLALLAAGALATTQRSRATSVPKAAAFGAQVASAQAIVPQPGQPTPVPGLVVSGDGDATATPDVAYVGLGVQSDGKTAREAMDANSTAMAAVVAAVKNAGVAENDIRTTGINLVPQYSQPRPGDQSPSVVVGYRAMNNVSVTVQDVARTGDVLDAAISAGANSTGGVQFSVKDSSGFRQRALEAAARDARAKADALAGGLGLHVTGIISVTEQGTSGPQPRQAQPLAAASAADSGAAPPPPVQPGELTLRARVQVVFSFA